MVRDKNVAATEELRDVRDQWRELPGPGNPSATFCEELGVEGRETGGVYRAILCEVY